MASDRRDRHRAHRGSVLLLAVTLLTLSGYGGMTSDRSAPMAGAGTSVPASAGAAAADADLYVSAPARPAQPPSRTASTAAPATDDTATPSSHAAEPVRLEIPAILVDADIIPLGVTDDGRLQVPADFDQTGYWVGGAWPGEVGPAVIAGHIDSTEGPAVFFALRDLERGDRVIVHRADDSAVAFEVTELAYHPKDDFPTDAVYGRTDRPTLRLITCGGNFDRDSGHYLSNLIVYAEVAAEPAGAR